MTTSIDVRTALLTTLRGIKDAGPVAGICHNVAIACTDRAEVRLLAKLIASWPDKLPSEDAACPVEGCLFKHVAGRNRCQSYRSDNRRRLQ